MPEEAGEVEARAEGGGGAVEGLPTHTFPTEDGGVDMKCPTEIAIGDRREAELAKNGFNIFGELKSISYSPTVPIPKSGFW